MNTRVQQVEYVANEQIENAFHRLLAAALDQRAPSPRLVQRLNRVLTLVGHPLRDRDFDVEAA